MNKITNTNSLSQTPINLYLQSLSENGQKTMITRLKVTLKLLEIKQDIYHFPWQQLEYEDIAKVRFLLINHGYKINTINTTLAAIKSVMKTCLNLKLITHENYGQIQYVKPVRGNDSKTGLFLSKIQVRSLIKSTSGKSKLNDQRDKALLAVLIYSGLRKSEMIHLRLSDCNMNTSVIYVRCGKGRKSREVTLPDKAWQWIKPWLIEKAKLKGENVYLFTAIHKSGLIREKPLSGQAVSEIVKAAGIAINIEGLTPHDLRRSYISNLLSSKVDINLVRQLAGHSDIQTTSRYDLRGKEELTAAVKNWKI